jgi:hypothetical protein
MADININKFRTSVVREGSRPASAGFVESEGQDPVDPAGSTQNHLPVTIAPAADGLSITDSQVLGGAGTTAQYLRGDGSLATFPSLTGFVPYTGATADVDLGTHDLTAERGTFDNNGSSDALTVTHTSGSGYGIIVTKGGNNEALYVEKTSGSGNAMRVLGGNFGAEAATFSGVVTTTPDAVINGVNVGRGGGNAIENTRLGNSALSVNTTGTGNTAAGSFALSKNTTGVGNTAVGTQTLQENTTGEGNTAVGQFSLIDNTTGLRNSALGYLSLSDNTTGIDNVGIGFFSLFTNTTGSDNTALGHNSGSYIADGSTTNSITNNSIYIGSDTKALANNQTNQIVIGHNATGNGSNTVTIGNSSITDNYFTGNIRGGAFIKSGGTSAQFLKADGSVDSTSYGTGSVTSVAALTLGTSGTDLSSTVANGTTTPVITLNVPTASATNRGALSSADWSTFNSKQAQLNGTGFVKVSGTTISYDNTSYLPLTGGTLTGPLGGTSASFNLTNGSVLTRDNGTTQVEVNLRQTTKNAVISFTQDAIADRWAIGTKPNDGTLYFSANFDLSTTRFTLTSAGAGTFSGSISSDQTDGGALFTKTAGANAGLITSTFQIIGSGSKVDLNAFVYGSNDFGVWTNSSKRLTIAGSTGAATFSSSVTAASIIRSGGTSSQYLMADGSVSTLSNPVTGTGVNGRVAFWNGTNTITSDSDLLFNGNTLTLLTGNVEIAAGNGLILFNPNTTNYFQLYTNNGNELNFGFGGTTPVVAKISSSGTMTLTGDIFIQKAAPSVQLRAGNGSNAGFILANSSNTHNWTFESDFGASGQQGELRIRNSILGSNAITISTSNAATFSSSVTANDLISTSYGTARIQVTSTTNSANSAIRFGAKDSGGTTKNAGLYYVAGTTTGNTFLSLVADDNNYQFNVLANGNVGVGTTSITRRLTISEGTGSNTNAYMSFNNSAERWVIGNEGGLGTGTNDFFFFADGAYRMVIKQGGNVLIGTTTVGASRLRIVGLPTSAAGLSSGDVYNLAGVLMIA